MRRRREYPAHRVFAEPKNVKLVCCSLSLSLSLALLSFSLVRIAHNDTEFCFPPSLSIPIVVAAEAAKKKVEASKGKGKRGKRGKAAAAADDDDSAAADKDGDSTMGKADKQEKTAAAADDSGSGDADMKIDAKAARSAAASKKSSSVVFDSKNNKKLDDANLKAVLAAAANEEAAQKKADEDGVNEWTPDQPSPALIAKLSVPRWIEFEHLTLHAKEHLYTPPPVHNQFSFWGGSSTYQPPAYHLNSVLCSKESFLLTVDSGGGTSRGRKRAVRKKKLFDRPDISKLTGELLQSAIVGSPAWGGLLKMRKSADVVTIISDALLDSAYAWSSDLSRIVFDYIDRQYVMSLPWGWVVCLWSGSDDPNL